MATTGSEALRPFAVHARHKAARVRFGIAKGIASTLMLPGAQAAEFVTADPLRAFVYREYPLGSDYFIRGNSDTTIFRCVLTNAQRRFAGIALSEISIWGNRTGPWGVFRTRPDGTFTYVETGYLADTSCLESCQSKEYLASGQCTWSRGWPKP